MKCFDVLRPVHEAVEMNAIMLYIPIENVRNIINPSSIDQSRLQCDYKRMSNPAIIHWIGSQILGTCFCFNPDRIVPII